MLHFMNFTLFTNFIGLLLALFSVTVNALPIGELHMRDVFVPPVTSPTADAVWAVGSVQTVTWNTTDAPEQITNPIGRIMLRKGGLTTNNTLADGFDILLGTINVTVPDVEPGDDYEIVLFGDSGNFSPVFEIVAADNGY
ncbi:hypothetical protein K435DRAFT_762862 [Dendrothele bispora CBS 962.96]|uniref:Yeast cell wall synthesis Kre9/Knh1-like N-terminal domain-containing protein n=1 Tax=Dendrothele bispora (strain CBS 962.96) TaxID=1314807 RepID=A0A4S8LEJ1_DENBC|nr:hypothetical protein K435DRAFT_762862 [Dendrothele bispora CBS 962.96]